MIRPARAVSLAALVGVCALFLGAPVTPQAQAPADWTMGGQNLSNTRQQIAEGALGSSTVAGLRRKWVFTTGGDVSATPVVGGGAVYFPDWGGNLFKLDAETGDLVWAHQLAEYTGVATVSRTAPALGDGVLYLGTRQGAYALAVDMATGNLIWRTQVESNPAAIITQSPVVFGQRVYVGVSSNESMIPNALCCTFRGSMVALDAQSGQVVWKMYTTPDNGGKKNGYSGNSVWGGTPVVDVSRNTLYFTTGNNHSVPSDVEACQAAFLANPSLPSCIAADNYVDSIIAVDLTSGALKWSSKLQGYDAWNFHCFPIGGKPRSGCPVPTGPDFDFGQGVMLYNVGGGSTQFLGAGQKSGIFWALAPDTGAVVWSTIVGPSGKLGGIQWGSATDGGRIYVAVSNSLKKRYVLTPSGDVTYGGAWSAIDAATGAIIWQTPTPAEAMALGPVTVANGVVYGGSMARTGLNMFALDAATGAILWSYPSGGSVVAGAAVVGGTVYWGSGYSHLGQGSANNKFYAFALRPGR